PKKSMSSATAARPLLAAAQLSRPRPAATARPLFRPVPQLATRVAPLVSGQADLVSDIPPDQTGKIQQSGNAHVEISTLGGFVIMVKMTNYLMPGPWTDVRVRRGHHRTHDQERHL